jgi:light-harvesting protein B-800-850 alpha chain
MILNNTTWVKAFLNGNADKVASASASAAASAAPAAPAVKK